MTDSDSSFDHKSPADLVNHLREHAARVAGGFASANDGRYDPETLSLENDAARLIERLVLKLAKIREIAEGRRFYEEQSERGCFEALGEIRTIATL